MREESPGGRKGEKAYAGVGNSPAPTQCQGCAIAQKLSSERSYGLPA